MAVGGGRRRLEGTNGSLTVLERSLGAILHALKHRPAERS